MMKMNNLSLIASVDRNWGIGKDNKLLFPIKRDMAQFKELTTGNIVIMGRKTLDSLPDGKPLPDRINIVLTRKGNSTGNKDFKRDDVIVCHSVDELAGVVDTYPQRHPFVIGGSEIYRLILPYCSAAYITRVNAVKSADTYMVNLDENPDWTLTEKSEEFTENGISFTFCTYKQGH